MAAMANERIWAPDRLRYVKQADGAGGECIFCAKPEMSDDEALIVHRGTHCFVMLNLYPYTNGHVMVSPFEHVGRIQEIGAETMAELMELVQRSMVAIEAAYNPKGFNVGVNQGKAGGAGVAGHIHIHVVPRWEGDTNFMPVIADAKVMPQSLEDSYATLSEAFDA